MSKKEILLVVIVLIILAAPLLLFKGGITSFVGYASSSGSNANWTNLTAISEPPPGLPVMVYDSARGKIIIFGPNSVAGAPTNNDTWEFAGDVWTKIVPSDSPGPLLLPGFAFVPTRNVTVLFGGLNASGVPTNDTWEYNASIPNWTEKVTANAPLPSYVVGMAYDANVNKIVLVGGTLGAGIGSNETWFYDGNNWVNETSSITRAPPSSWGSMAYDSDRKVDVYFIGQYQGGAGANETWEFNGSSMTWTNITMPQPEKRIGFLAYDKNAKKTIMFAGLSGSEVLNDTWGYDGTWAVLNVSGTPPAGFPGTTGTLAAIAYDSAIGKDVVFYGYDFATSLLVNETWEISLAKTGATNLTIWDSTDANMTLANQTKYVNDSVNFFANYTNETSGTEIVGANCNVNFTDVSASMGFNATNQLYQYNRSFSTNGTFAFNVTCSAANFATLTANDTAAINPLSANNSNLTIWDETDAGKPFGGQTKVANSTVNFFANYTNITSGVLISGAACVINFSSLSGNMSFNSTNNIYEFNNSFAANGGHPYNVTCSAAGFTTRAAQNSITIPTLAPSPTPSQSAIVGPAGPVHISPAIGLYAIEPIDLSEQPYEYIYSQGDRIIFRLDTERHTMQVMNISKDSVSLQFGSAILNVVVKLGATANIDLDNDNTNDIYVTVKSISQNKTDIVIGKLTVIPKPAAVTNVTAPTKAAPAPAPAAPSVQQPAKFSLLEALSQYKTPFIYLGSLVVLVLISVGSLSVYRQRQVYIVPEMLHPEELEAVRTMAKTKLESILDDVYAQIKKNVSDDIIRSTLEDQGVPANVIRSILYEARNENNRLDQLVLFVKAQRVRGVADAEIKEELLKSAWSDEIIAVVFS